MRLPLRPPFLVLVLVLVLVLLPPSSSSSYALTLEEAVRTASAQNYDLAREAISVAQADAGITVADGAFDLRLGADAGVQRYLSTFSGPQTDSTWDVYLAKRISSGADLQLRLDTSLTRTTFFLVCDTAIDSDEECNLFTPSLKATFTQPLLRGAWQTVVESPLHKAQGARSVASWRRAARASEIVRDVIIAYWEAAYATEELGIRQGALALAQKQLDLTRAEIAAGRLAPTDSLSVELAIVQREAELVLAENGRVERSLVLGRLLGASIQTEDPVYRIADVPAVEPQVPDPAARRITALERNPSLQAIRADGRVKQIDVEVTRRGLLPQLNLAGSIGVAGQDDSYGGALGNMFDSEAHDQDNAALVWSAGLSFLHYFGDGTAHGTERIAQLEAQRATLTQADLEAEIGAQSLRLSLALKAAAKLVESARVAHRLAQQNLDAEQARFAVGRVRNQDVLARQEELRQAQLRELRSRVDYLRTRAALDALTGDLLDRYHIAPR